MPRTHLELLARAAQLLACLAAAAHQRLDRAARQLTGAPDSVDQHWAETLAGTGQTPSTWRPSSAAEREYVDAVARLIALPHPDAIPDTHAWHGNINLTDIVDVLVRHIPANTVGAPEHGLVTEPPEYGHPVATLTNITVHDSVQTARALQRLAKDYYGDGPVFVAPSDGDDLAALLRNEGLLLARRTG